MIWIFFRKTRNSRKSMPSIKYMQHSIKIEQSKMRLHVRNFCILLINHVVSVNIHRQDYKYPMILKKNAFDFFKWCVMCMVDYTIQHINFESSSIPVKEKVFLDGFVFYVFLRSPLDTLVSFIFLFIARTWLRTSCCFLADRYSWYCV